MRQLNFYTYQMSQESAFQALITKNAQEVRSTTCCDYFANDFSQRIAVLEAQNNNLIREATSEIACESARLCSAKAWIAENVS